MMGESLVKLQLRAYRTLDRHDDEGEFLIRLPPEARRRLPYGCHYVVVENPAGKLYEDGECLAPSVIAAVRDLSRDDKLAIRDRSAFCQLDMSLRVAVGVKGFHPTNDAELPDKTGNGKHITIAPLQSGQESRNIRLSKLESWLGYQWMLFRVQRAIAGDFETPICRAHGQYLATLGIHDGGIVVLESVRGRAIRRLLACDEAHEAKPELDFEKQFGIDDALRMPCIYIDKSTRQQLGVVPGQVVWVRRELRSVFRKELLKNASALALAVLGIAFSLREFVESTFKGWGGKALMIIFAAILLTLVGCAIYECRDRVRAD